jgi:hypothetical protein
MAVPTAFIAGPLTLAVRRLQETIRNDVVGDWYISNLPNIHRHGHESASRDEELSKVSHWRAQECEMDAPATS